MKCIGISLLLVSITTCALFSTNEALNEAQCLHKVIWAPRQFDDPLFDSSLPVDIDSDHIVIPRSAKAQRTLRKADRVKSLPGQPEGVDFEQYAGYITVNKEEGRKLFYYFTESPQNSSSKPLILWLNGGPGCSSLGYGAFEEVGPFRVNADGKTLTRNKYAWNNLANILFLESPAGVGFSKAKDDQVNRDAVTAKESYIFLLNWLERFPHFKNRHFFMAGESYAGHYIPQLAKVILSQNELKNRTIVNLKGVAIGNAFIDKFDNRRSRDEYFWRRDFISDGDYEALRKECESFYRTDNFTQACEDARYRIALGYFDVYNIYAPLCLTFPNGSIKKTDEVELGIDPCIDNFVEKYLNLPEVKRALHADQNVTWSICSDIEYLHDVDTTVPTIKKIIEKGLRVMLYSGDSDSMVPIVTTKNSVKNMKLHVKKPWRPWNCDEQVGGFVEEYEGLTLVSIRGAGHMVPSNQPQRAFTMITHFLQGKQLP